MRAYNSFAIEVFDEPAGVIVQQSRGYRFFASTQRFHALEGRVFRNARMAEREARRIVEQTEGNARH